MVGENDAVAVIRSRLLHAQVTRLLTRDTWEMQRVKCCDEFLCERVEVDTQLRFLWNIEQEDANPEGLKSLSMSLHKEQVHTRTVEALNQTLAYST